MSLQRREEEFGSTDFYSAKRDLKAVKMDGIDLTSFWKEYNTKYAHLLACGGMMSYADQLETVLENVHQRFYRDVIISTRKSIGNLQSEKINRSHFTTLRSNLLEHYNVTPIVERQEFQRKALAHSANGNNSPKMMCDHCRKYNRYRIMRTHTTDRCRIGDQFTWNRNSKVADFNKGTEQYSNFSSSFHDSGSTPKSFFKDKPDQCVDSTGFVSTANNGKAQIVGTGSVTFGKMTLDDVAYVPTFAKNLDHRGTEESPGRVVTLIKYEEWQSKYSEIDATITDDKVYGCLYKIADESKQAVFDHLDYREKGGYEMQTVKVYTNEGVIESYLYIADYHNDNYLGPSDLDSMAKQIGFTVGPSGNNSDYLLNLCKALREIGAEEDLHLMELEKRVVQLLNPSSA
ncbi:hypothetical protein HK103_001937 [Boothiomyces macroporosus]|uniref:glutathione-specific gamma-glutamylcyclotransferase n=1 Tax=Boothiomyces macroporosus TaxID=261099 RepID=A0AAD5UJ89_9FUNG|nr:hypothetical protein HK103_001937 [Boothiomyces macroporosus]